MLHFPIYTSKQVQNIDISDMQTTLLYTTYDKLVQHNIADNVYDGYPFKIYQTKSITKESNKNIALIVAGMHGNEKASCFGVALAFREIAQSNDDWAQFIKNKVRVQVVPCVNIFGFNKNQRNNLYNVDLNRDFIALSQKQSKFLANYIDNNIEQIRIVLDSHNCADEQYFFINLKSQHAKIYADCANLLTDTLHYKVAAKESDKPNALNAFIASRPSILGHTIETPRSIQTHLVRQSEGYLKNYSDSSKIIKEIIINTLIQYCRYI